VDAVVTLAAMPVPMDDWGIDVCLTGGQKALSSIPGVSICAFSEDAWRAVERHPSPRPHWCYDALRAQRFWGEQQYHYTAGARRAGLHEALRLVAEETLERRFRRHALSAQAMQAGLEAMGLTLFAAKDVRLNSVLAIAMPPGADSARVRGYMTRAFRVEISGAFGLDIVRIGQMGEQCRSHNLFKTLYALGMSLEREGVKLDVAGGMAALEQGLAATAKRSGLPRPWRMSTRCQPGNGSRSRGHGIPFRRRTTRSASRRTLRCCADASPDQMRAGVLIDTLSLRGMPMRWRTEITAWDPPRRFEDRQLTGPYRQWLHTHLFEEADGGTTVRDEVRYRLRGPDLLTRPINRLLVQPDVSRIFAYRHGALEQALGVEGRSRTGPVSIVRGHL
jgi:hypothetical protein